MITKAIGLVCLLGAACVAAAEDAAVIQAEQGWAKAVLARDIAGLEKIYTADLIYAHSTGNVETRQMYLDRLKGGKQRYDDIQFEKTIVKAYGDAAVVHSFARMIGKNDSGPFNDHLMIIHLWVKQGGAWKLAAHQTTKIP
jgi:ketosteroid isomerase-like protein